ncbi:hypothetical protein BDF20DRAFT_852097, partial [Mycotypha africana]|uniref:uncharacterized protein n=1 Tax=Mycotypha africana TaxID=64632 RepID=UPI00230125D6
MTPPFAFVMLDTVFSCSGGVFITVVFFTDPVIANVLSSTYKGWYTKYVEEYTLIPADGCVPLQNDRFMTANSTSSSLVFENEMPFILTNSMPKCSLKEHTGGAMPHVGLLTTAEFTSDSKNQFRHATKMTPMRKFRLLHRDFTDNSQRNRLNSTVVSTIIPPRAIIARNGRHFQRHQQQMHSLIPLMSPDLHNIYIPYRFPSIATYIHNVLVALDRFRTFKLRKREEHFATDQSNRNRESQFRDNRQKHPNQHYSLSKDRQESNITLCINPTECTTATETVSNNNLDQTLTNIPLVMYNNLHTSAITSPLIDVNYNRNNDRCSVDSMTESI